MGTSDPIPINPRRIPGNWDDGFALDLHTLRSEFLGHDEYGHAQFETVRTPLGELLYKLKYQGDRSVVPLIAKVACAFVRRWNPRPGVVVPVPPSRRRRVQPLFEIADEMGRILHVPVDKRSVRRTLDNPELKNIYEYGKRLEALEGAHSADASALRGRRVLLLDDLYRSGATLNAVTKLIKTTGGAAAVFALTLTRTRSST
jgi:predicted amidophosphoribosyltransferase